jgi:excisionase family DNA binding protein
MSKPDFITRFQAAEYLGISVRTLDRTLQERQIPFYLLRGRVYFKKYRLVEWLTSLGHNPLNHKESAAIQTGKRERKNLMHEGLEQ